MLVVLLHPISELSAIDVVAISELASADGLIVDDSSCPRIFMTKPGGISVARSFLRVESMP